MFGGFATGIVPPQPGSSTARPPTELKLFGDINGDGNMVYVEYTCDTDRHEAVSQPDGVRRRGQACR